MSSASVHVGVSTDNTTIRMNTNITGRIGDRLRSKQGGVFGNDKSYGRVQPSPGREIGSRRTRCCVYGIVLMVLSGGVVCHYRREKMKQWR